MTPDTERRAAAPIDMDELSARMGGMRIATHGSEAPVADEPLFARVPLRAGMPAAEVIDVLVQRFGSSECEPLVRDPGFLQSLAGARPSSARLATYLSEHMWLERLRPRRGTVYLNAAEGFRRVIGLSPQGWCAVLCSEGRVCSFRAPMGAEGWQAHRAYRAPLDRGEPRVCNIDGHTAVLHYPYWPDNDEPQEVHVVQLAEPDRPALVLTPEHPVHYVVANHLYTVVLDPEGRVAVYASDDGRLVMDYTVVRAPLMAPALPAASGTNPMTGQPLESEPAVRMPLVPHQIQMALFNELDPASLVLCSAHGVAFTLRMPEEPPRELWALDGRELTMYDFVVDAGTPSERPTREAAYTACYRECGADMLLVRAGAHALLATSQQTVKDQPHATERAVSHRVCDAVTAWNCVAALGTALVAHGRDGSLHVFSMLERRVGRAQPDPLTRETALTKCERGYRSLYVTATVVTCLLWDGRLLHVL